MFQKIALAGLAAALLFAAAGPGGFDGEWPVDPGQLP